MRRLNRWAWAEILAALLLLVAVLASWWTTERRETEAEISYLLSVYGEQMESRLSGMDRTMGILLENGEDLALMGDDLESERQHAMIRMRKTLQATLRIDLSAEWGAIAHSAYGAEIQAGEAAPALAQKERIRDSVRRAAAGASGLGAAWAEVSLNGEIFFRRETVRRNQAIHLYVRRETLMGPIRRQEQNGLNWSIVSDGTENPVGNEASGDSAADTDGSGVSAHTARGAAHTARTAQKRDKSRFIFFAASMRCCNVRLYSFCPGYQPDTIKKTSSFGNRMLSPICFAISRSDSACRSNILKYWFAELNRLSVRL